MTSAKLLHRLLDFRARGGRVVNSVPDTRLGRHVAGQRVRCSTSLPPNYADGCAAESIDDIICKLSIVLKERVDSNVWRRFIVPAKLLPDQL